MNKNKSRPIHSIHPNSQPHPFKAGTLCGRLVRFGGIEISGERPVTCNQCIKVLEKICPTCRGTGLKAEQV